MKPSQMKELSFSDLKEKLSDERQALADMKFQHAISSMENPVVLGAKRKTIARLLTELNARTDEK